MSMLPQSPQRRGVNPVSATLVILAAVVAASTAGWIVGEQLTRPKEVPAEALPSPAEEFEVIVAQEEMDDSFLVQHYAGGYQKVAQTFTVPDEDMRLLSIVPYINFVRGRFSVTIRKHPVDRAAPAGKPLRTMVVDAFDVESSGFYPVQLRPALPLEQGQGYSFLIEVRDRRSSVIVGRLRFRDGYPSGRAWYFTRLTDPNGGLLTRHNVWQMWHDDLAFRLDFERCATCDG